MMEKFADFKVLQVSVLVLYANVSVVFYIVKEVNTFLLEQKSFNVNFTYSSFIGKSFFEIVAVILDTL